MIYRLLVIACLLAFAPAAHGANGTPHEGNKAGPANPADAKLAALLDDIDARAGRVADLTGQFRQEKFTALLKKPLVSTGRIRMKGSVVRWDTESPEPSVLYSDGREIRMYYPRQSTVEIYPIDSRISDLAASPLPRLALLREHFKIESLPSKDTGDEERDQTKFVNLKLTPTDAFLIEHLDEVRVALDVASACVERVEMFDADGDRTLIRFTHLKADTGIREGDLALDLPSGTKVSRPLDASRRGDRN